MSDDSTEHIFTGKVFELVREQYEMDDGQTVVRDTVRHPGAVVMLPVTAQGTLLLLKQYRHSVRETIVEFPAGTLEKNEDILACAKRELIEEVGFSASDWESLGTLYPAPGFCNEVQHLFLARELSPAEADADEDEEIEVIERSLEEVRRMILDNEIRDAKSLGIFLRAVLVGELQPLSL